MISAFQFLPTAVKFSASGVEPPAGVDRDVGETSPLSDTSSAAGRHSAGRGDRRVRVGCLGAGVTALACVTAALIGTFPVTVAVCTGRRWRVCPVRAPSTFAFNPGDVGQREGSTCPDRRRDAWWVMCGMGAFPDIGIERIDPCGDPDDLRLVPVVRADGSAVVKVIW